MSDNLPQIPPRDQPLSERFAYYKRQVESNGGTVGTERPTVLGLRGLAPDGRRHDSNENIGPYNDTFVIMEQRPDGEQQLHELPGSTHAGQKSSSISPGGVAQIRPGSFLCHPNGHHNSMPSWHIRMPNDSGRIPAWRDINKNGYISESEKRRAEDNNVVATEILFHNGVNTDHGRSIGCQTLAPRVMAQMVDILGEDQTFHFTLIDANRPTPGETAPTRARERT
ncbi:MAG: hypothetical protein AB1758_26595 [Candidatus Eremiobacterota bacterium]